MARDPSPWRWALYASVLFLMAGTILTMTADGDESRRRSGIAIFVAAAAVYAFARIVTFVKGRK